MAPLLEGKAPIKVHPGITAVNSVNLTIRQRFTSACAARMVGFAVQVRGRPPAPSHVAPGISDCEGDSDLEVLFLDEPLAKLRRSSGGNDRKTVMRRSSLIDRMPVTDLSPVLSEQPRE